MSREPPAQERALRQMGGVQMPILGSIEAPGFVEGGDVFWLDGTDHALLRLAAAFDRETMDAVLLFHRTAAAVGFTPKMPVIEVIAAARDGVAKD